MNAARLNRFNNANNAGAASQSSGLPQPTPVASVSSVRTGSTTRRAYYAHHYQRIMRMQQNSLITAGQAKNLKLLLRDQDETLDMIMRGCFDQVEFPDEKLLEEIEGMGLVDG